MPAKKSSVVFHPLTSERWPDFEKLFGERGACGGCWCAYWRRPRSEFNRDKGSGNQRFMLKLVQDGEPPGILAYIEGEAVGWCAVAPRAEYPALKRSRILSPVDEQPVWSISCFFVHKEHRKKGLSIHLLRAAIDFVKQRGGQCVEGYPVEPKTAAMPAAFAWVGLASAFLAAGFREVVRRSATRPIMRYEIKQIRRPAK